MIGKVFLFPRGQYSESDGNQNIAEKTGEWYLDIDSGLSLKVNRICLSGGVQFADPGMVSCQSCYNRGRIVVRYGLSKSYHFVI